MQTGHERNNTEGKMVSETAGMFDEGGCTAAVREMSCRLRRHKQSVRRLRRRLLHITVNSPFKDTGLLKYLTEKQTSQIIAVGLQTDYCMDAAVKCGFEHGFHMIVPEGTNSTFDNQCLSAEVTYRYYNEFIWKGRYADCILMEEPLAFIS